MATVIISRLSALECCATASKASVCRRCLTPLQSLQLCADVLERALVPCKKVMADAKLTFDQLDVIEVVGESRLH